MKHLLTKGIFFGIVSGLFISIGFAQSPCPDVQNLYSKLPIATKQSSWQQSCHYVIDVALDDLHHVLRGSWEMAYTNNSPDTLTRIYIHLWPNAYKDDQTPFARQQLLKNNWEFEQSDSLDKGWIDSLDFSSSGKRLEACGLDGELATVFLAQPLLPGQSVTLKTAFRVKIPKTFSRMGHIGQSYQITQWYPKPAVYDANGWNPMPYLDQGEFYSEFGSFKVSITVPENYTVASTGICDQPDEYDENRKRSNDLKKKIAEDPKKKWRSADIPSSSAIKTLTFRQDRVHDFAWFADKTLLVTEDTAVLPSGRRVPCMMYRLTGKTDGVKTIKNTLEYLSQYVGEYPYDICQAITGPLKAGEGMEYPTITIVDDGGEQVIEHEVGHNWFYGILGSNERFFPWMDEGINSFYENRYFELEGISPIGLTKVLKGDYSVLNNPRLEHYATWILLARVGRDQAIGLPSEMYSLINYAGIVYGKTALAFQELKDYLGDATFDTAMHAYFNRWKFKHPLPGDLRQVLESSSGKDLSWFFDGTIGTRKIHDYRITRLKKSDATHVEVIIKNRGQIAAPYRLVGLSKGNEVFDTVINGSLTTQHIVVPSGFTKLSIDPEINSLDLYRHNNVYRKSGPGRRMNRFKIKALGGLEGTDNYKVYPMIAPAWNRYDGFMLGALFHNISLPHRRFYFIGVPLYSFSTKALRGQGRLVWETPLREGWISKIKVGARMKSYGLPSLDFFESTPKNGYYAVYEPFVECLHWAEDARKPVNQRLRLSYSMVKTSPDGFAGLSTGYGVTALAWDRHAEHPAHPKATAVLLENITGGITKLSITQTFSWFWTEKKYASLRLFGGVMTGADKLSENRFQFRPAGNNGYFDYTYSTFQFGRYDGVMGGGLFMNQLTPRDGGMRLPTALGSSNKWLVSARFTSAVPGILPVKLYADVAYFSQSQWLVSTASFAQTPTLYYTGGIAVVVMDGFLECYLPVLNSSNITAIWNTSSVNYGQRIGFIIYPENLKKNKNLMGLFF